MSDMPDMSEEQTEQKPFLPSYRYRPLARFIFCIVGMFLAFGLMSVFESTKACPRELLKITFGAFITFLSGAFFFFGQYVWTMFIKGGWREEHKRYIAQLQPPRQPWDKD